MKKMSKILLILSFIILSSCGFKVVDTSKLNNFLIQEVKTIGDKKTSFKIKNNLLLSSKKNNENVLIINLNTVKKRNIKEKNIKNEITKYEIVLEVEVEFDLLNRNINDKFTINASGDYLIGSNYSTTLNNEKKLIDDLSENISDKILNRINLKINDI
ncbi:MAG: hypothetical protein CBC88_01860 [Candidatus Pelagibacter sp. TMED128]|nr:MAG: hypothetical protein CBC88_01860 [Candidatus Pelagibacter sp. TMED128]|tara:strand:- start:1209 stop:1682 length:474 start_codon:yes stop_codon:yes gene_type:complete